MTALVQLLHDDAVLTMPPFPLWLRGAGDVVHWMSNQGIGCQGSRLIPMTMNGTAAYASYKPATDGTDRLLPWAIQVIDVQDGAIVGHHNFIGPELFAEHGLPDHL